jgi:hypothetical protein
MNRHNRTISTFNSPLETGVRVVALLVSMYPTPVDLRRITYFDYLVVHSGDADGPESLHPPLPLRSGEILVRHELIEKGIVLMISRGLVIRTSSENGFNFTATDAAGPFMDALKTPYLTKLKERATWVSETFGDTSIEGIERLMKKIFDIWTLDLQPKEKSLGADL